MSDPTETSRDLSCLLLGLVIDSSGGGGAGWLGRRVRLMMQQRSIALQAPRKLIDPIKTTVTAASEVADASFVLAEVSVPDPVIFYYLGLAHSQGKPILSLRRFDAPAAVPVHRQADFRIDYEDSVPGQEELAKQLNAALDAIERTDRLDHGMLLGLGEQATLDWSALSPTENENLCFELLLREGFRQLSWLDGSGEPKLTALQPREDGSSELFVIAPGSGLEDAFSVRAWKTDLDALGRRLTELFEHHRLSGEDGKIDLNLLFLWTPQGSDDRVMVEREYAAQLGQLLVPLLSHVGRPLVPRFTAWHRQRLESLVRRWPMLVRQYFAREAAGEPQDRRKTLEDLYREAARLGQRAAEASGHLEQKYGIDPGFEWQRRAYTVTHSIGNAIFPVETYLDFIAERLAESGDPEGRALADRALASVEKTKVHIFKFKNIARFKKPRLRPVDVLPRLNMSLAAAEARGIKVDRYIGEHPPVSADADLLDELIDELVANSITWLEQSGERRLIVTLKLAKGDDLSPHLHRSSEEFLWLRYADTGPGVAHEIKEKIFELFYSTNPQGMGFGLAIVRKNLRDFGGDIVETGMPGHGVCFDIFLPLADGATAPVGEGGAYE